MMLLVTDPGSYAAVYPQLLHAAWNGLTATDLVSPCFLLSVGISFSLSFTARLGRGATRGQLALHVVRRSLWLVLLGLVVNGFPAYHLPTLRLPGILQKIAFCYLLAALLYLACCGPGFQTGPDRQPSPRRSAVLLAAALLLLLGYWALLRYTPVPGFGPNRLDPVGYLGAWLDRRLFTVAHLWPWGTPTGTRPGQGVTYDPDGLLSSVPAVATVLFGALCGEWLQTARSGARKLVGMVVAGAVLTAVGEAASLAVPFNKRIWTSSYGFFVSGAALLLFALFYRVIDLGRWRRGLAPLLVLGTNAIFAFILGSLLTSLASLISLRGQGGRPTHVPGWVYAHLLTLSLPPRIASLTYALLFVAVNVALVSVLYRRRIFLRL